MAKREPLKAPRPLLFLPLGIHEIDHVWDDEEISLQDREEHDKAAHELHMSHRVLVQAVEGYLLGCVELFGIDR